MLPSPPASESEHYKAIVLKQIALGVIVCPETRSKLEFRTAELLGTEQGTRTYAILNGKVPVLIADRKLMEEYAKSSRQMNVEYTERHLQRQDTWFNRLRKRDYRTAASIRAKSMIFENLSEDAVCVSIGGGPTRADVRLVNLNIGPFPNVDIVGDAHSLPYASDTVDAIHCEAVFEHLHTPELAAREISRVLRAGGKAYVCTPFLQAYHGYPHHYQNYTITGHTRLFERAGLKIISSGTCVGPTYVFRNLIAVYIANYVPFPINKVLRILWGGISMAIAPLDVLLGNNPNSHVMASMTYLVAEKP